MNLYKILQTLRPDVIFVEMPPSLFSKYYLEKSKSKLETIAVGRYLEGFNAVIVPVDIDDIPTDIFFIDYGNAMERVLGLADINGHNLRTLLSTKKYYSSIHGFKFLNSEDYVHYDDRVKGAIENGLKKIDDENLNLAYQKWKEFTDKRENEMLQNIYNYCRAEKYNKAIFLLGASHRKSIKEKIKVYQLNEYVELNWVIYEEQ